MSYLEPGQELKVNEYIYHAHGDKEIIAALVQFSPTELQEKEKQSIEREKAIFSELKAVVGKWRQQANQTINLRKAQEYLRSSPALHTSNKWVKGQYDWYEISNAVYKMRYHIYERELYGYHRDPRPVVWELSWSVYYNTPLKPDLDSKNHIAGQDRKRFDSKADMEKYLQGRIKAYSHLFTAISPPIPKDQERRFCVNGVLLPGYTVESPELLEPDKAQVEDLLSLLSDEDIGGKVPEPASESQSEAKTPEAVWSKNHQRRQRPGKTKQTPAR